MDEGSLRQLTRDSMGWLSQRRAVGVLPQSALEKLHSMIAMAKMRKTILTHFKRSDSQTR